MAKAKTRYECSSCGAIYSSWAGKCGSCGDWNTIQAQLNVAEVELKKNGNSLKTSSVKTLVNKQSKLDERIKTGDSQLDIVLGGGFVPGSVILLAGQPGIGKSTLLMQIANALSNTHKVLYVSGEESANQVASRASRLKAVSDSLSIASSTSADDISHTIADGELDVVIVDSIQTITVETISSAAGTVSQITNSTQLLTKAAKQTNTVLILVGHVTKEGSIAGPKVLEHSVDCVLQFEGDRYGGFKVVRSIKNRYGSTNEAAIYEMEQDGLKAILNPSAALLSERQIVDGSVVLATMEGSRPVLVEIQALVNRTNYGYPKRASSGFDLNRLNLLIAMLERRTKLTLNDKDIYINVVGGIGVSEPAADLAVAMAIGSATKGLLLKKNAVVFGELGLSGEVRHVPHIDKRVAEASKLGFEAAIGPQLKSGKKPQLLTSVSDVKSALNSFLESK
jgi:DNA repair protein RadA/Sms